MSQNAVLTQGTILQRGDGGTPEVFSTVPDLVSFTGPDATKSEIDVTDLQSSAKEFKGGLADYGRDTLELNWIPGNPVHEAIRNDFASAASPVRNWKLLFVNGRTLSFAAYVAGFPGNVQGDSVVKASVTLRNTGAFVSS